MDHKLIEKLKSWLKFLPGNPKTRIGLDIGTDCIKFVEIKTKGEFKRLLSYRMVPISHLKGKPSEERLAEVLDLLRSLLKNRTSVPVYTAVSGSDVIIKSFNIARLSGAKLRNAAFWASKKYVPFPLEEAYFDCKVIGDTEEREIKKKEIMVVAAAKELIHKRLDMLEKSGLKIPGITVTPFALNNLLQVKEIGPLSIAVIDMGSENTSISIFQENTLKFAREIVTSGNSITESIVSQASISFEEAEKIKKEYGLSQTGTPKEFIKAIMPVIERLINEIQRSFSFYKESHPEFTIEKIYLTGGTARMEGLPQIMQERLNTDVEVIHSFEKLDISSPSIDSEEFNQLAPLFSKSVGLALEDNEGIDLLPSKVRQQKVINQMIPVFRLSAIFITLLCIMLYVDIATRVHIKTKSLNHWKSNMQKLNHLALNPGQIQVDSARYKMIKDTLDQIEKREIVDPFILKEITHIIPESIVLEDLSISLVEAPKEEDDDVSKVGVFQINGMVYGKEMDLEVNLLQFLVTLDTSPFLQKPVVTEKEKSVLAGRDILRFKIHCDLVS
ncbi:MAG: type IV pilus assembly protein PilM [bacterium]